MEEVEGAKDENVSKYSASLENGVETILKEVTDIRNEAQHEMILAEDAEHDKVVAFLSGLRDAVGKLQSEATRINKYQRLFKLQESTTESLGDTAEEVALKLSLWEGQAEWEGLTDSWRNTHFDSLDVAQMEETITR